ncbi:MAG: SDR family oxidoreductase [Marinilabiliaceae bacterium]|jgi:NAD(P)-dependent dehydrogenase (short-subunit alcohol dehydrogenase family)|nr:SDR family oxidoreductase [Marinilabiliaceae bacterium]
MTQAGSQFSIRDKVIVITGGEGLIGSTLATFFAGEGASIVLLGINDKKGAEISKQINLSGGSSIYIHADVLVRSSLLMAAEKAIETFGKLDVLINAAGGNRKGATIEQGQSIFDLDMDDFRSVSELNLDGTVLPSIVFGEKIASSGKGVIINFSSMAASRPLTRVVGYSAAKAAVENFTKWMAVEMADKYGDSVRVNAIAPGFLVSDQNRDLLLKTDGSLTKRGQDIIEQTPFGRFGKPEELAGTVMWLCSDASSFVTGAVIPVDGGFSAFSGV